MDYLRHFTEHANFAAKITKLMPAINGLSHLSQHAENENKSRKR